MTSGLRARLRKLLVRRMNVPDIPESLARLQRVGFVPQLVFDVGAFRGDFAASALEVWPAAKIACFEPLPHGRAQIEALRRRLPNIAIHATLVGASEVAGVEMHVANASSSLLRDAHNESYPVQTFPQTTVDAAVRGLYGGRAPELLKLDVQGYELEVLKGSEQALAADGVRAVLTEISLLDLHQGVPLLDQIVGWLAARGFVAYDICGLTRRPLDDALWQTDFIFLRRDDPLRGDKRYFKP
jgi:FkbM family methyltransferase